MILESHMIPVSTPQFFMMVVFALIGFITTLAALAHIAGIILRRLWIMAFGKRWRHPDFLVDRNFRVR